ncbi:MAG: nucleotidyltransferase domain-containing protein [Anaerolineae bacterium]|nr:nucleotidyltransferase domain-containing protein [Anaerolineae bacterium]
MHQDNKTYEQLIARFTAWAKQEENVRVAIIIGSRARTDHPADEWSDLDIIILAQDPEPYWQLDAWLHQLGTVWLTFVEPTPDGRGFERRVLFAPGLDVDFVPSPAVAFRQMLESHIPPDIADMIRRGIRIVVDKDNLAALLPDLPAAQAPTQPPQERDFLNLVRNFWYHTLWTAKHLRRGELWWAKAGCDMHLKGLLQQMLEWHARATRGQNIDTWLRGRFLEEWADPRAVMALRAAFAHYDEEDVWRALLATMDLFAWLERETAVALHFTYPTDGQTHTAELVKELFANR